MIYSTRLRGIAVQVLLILGVLVVVVVVAQSTAQNLTARGIPLGFEFLSLRAGFTISETVLPYSQRDTYLWAVAVGIANTLFISAIVIAGSTILGTLVGIGRLSSNPLITATCRTWVEIARNTPPILLLIFIYSLWWKILPPVEQAHQLAPGVHLSIRGLVMPRIELGLPPELIFAGMAASGAALWGAARYARYRQETTGRRPMAVALVILAGCLLLVGVILSAAIDMRVEWPRFERANFVGGVELTPELTTILIGLILYTTGFIAEIVRGGILAINRGQWEAARALGLNERNILGLVIIPQALRVIMPPLTSQYINVVKNSTLAIAVGYPDFMTVMGTIINRSSHAIEGVVVILGVFLVINLTLSALLNWYNRRVALVER